MPKQRYTIPLWCTLPRLEHFDGLGGCWGISSGEVRLKGEEHCKNCEYYWPGLSLRARCLWLVHQAAEAAGGE